MDQFSVCDNNMTKRLKKTSCYCGVSQSVGFICHLHLPSQPLPLQTPEAWKANSNPQD